MTRDELVEKVAREMWVHAGLDYTADDLCERAPAAARAAIRLIVEECARAADEVMEARAKGNEFADPGYIIRTLLPEEPSR